MIDKLITARKLIMFSDLHVHPFRPFSYLTQDGLNSRAAYTLKAVETILLEASELNEREEVAVLFLGDIFENRRILHSVYSVKLKNILSRFSKLSIYLLPGNHDYYGKTIDSSVLSLLTLENVICIDHPVYVLNMNAILHFHPYPIEGYTKFKDHLKDISPVKVSYDYSGGREKNKRHYLFTHVDMDGTHSGLDQHEIITGATVINDYNWFTRVLSGHYHWRQTVRNFTYLGTPIEKDFGDEGNSKGYHILDLLTDQLTFVELQDFPKFHRGTINKESDWEDWIMLREHRPIDYLRLTVPPEINIPEEMRMDQNPIPEIIIEKNSLNTTDIPELPIMENDDPIDLWVGYKKNLGQELSISSIRSMRYIYSKCKNGE